MNVLGNVRNVRMQPTDQVFAVAGLDSLNENARRHSAPAAFERRLRFLLTNVARGQIRIEAEPDDECMNPMHTVHGGYLATLLDAAMSASVHSLLEAGQRFTTVEMKVNFMKPALPFSSLRATGTVTKAGRRIAFAEGRVYSAKDELVASGCATCLIWEEHAASVDRAGVETATSGVHQGTGPANTTLEINFTREKP
ncbi:hypothetical protein GCM10027343_13910 [Noviherbaspirillum agri]